MFKKDKKENKMKVVAINGSPRRDGNTQYAIDVVAEEIRREGFDFETIHVGNQNIRGCISCYHCMMNKTGECVIKTDKTNDYIKKLTEADAIILGSPTYYANIAGTMKSFLDRAFFVGSFGSPEELFKGKIGAGVVAVRRSGGMGVFNALNTYFMEAGMVVPGSSYWNIIHGMMPGDAARDEEGIQTMRILGKNIAYLLKQKEAGKEVKLPEDEEKIMTNFVR